MQRAHHEEGWLSGEEESRLTRWLGVDELAGFGLPPLLRLGGFPILAQGREHLMCKRKSCPVYGAPDGFYGGSDQLRVLAVVHETPDFPMVTEDGGNPFVQVVFLLCPSCYGVRAVSGCD